MRFPKWWPQCGFAYRPPANGSRDWLVCTEPMLHYWLGGSKVHKTTYKPGGIVR
jgi:hypothetical protein